MIIDCHAHFTTAPAALLRFRAEQLAKLEVNVAEPSFSDDEIREGLEGAQLRLMRERGHDMSIFSPIAGRMGHHEGDALASAQWTRICNDLIYRVTQLYPDKFASVCQLPQAAGVAPVNCIEELRRCVLELGAVGCNLNPDPSGGNWSDPPLTDPSWFPIYEELVDLDVPAMIHVSSACNPNFHHFLGSHYLNGDTTAFMQLIASDLFERFPTLRFIIPHGGGAAPYHWGRFRGLVQDLGLPPLSERLNNIYFDTCVYHQSGIDLLARTIPADNILFASEMVGAVRGIDPETGRFYDDTRPFVEGVPWLTAADKQKIFCDNALRVYPRFAAHIAKKAAGGDTNG